MFFHRITRFLLAAGLAGCGPVSQTVPRTGAALPPAREMRGELDAAGRGQVVFENACIRCHGLDAAADSAPDMRLIARRYRSEFDDESAAAERVAAWIGAPSSDRALLPPTAVQHWGVMQRVALDRDLALDVGRFIWSLGAPDSGSLARNPRNQTAFPASGVSR